MIVALGPLDATPSMISVWAVLVMLRSPVRDAISWPVVFEFGMVRLYVPDES